MTLSLKEKDINLRISEIDLYERKLNDLKKEENLLLFIKDYPYFFSLFIASASDEVDSPCFLSCEYLDIKNYNFYRNNPFFNIVRSIYFNSEYTALEQFNKIYKNERLEGEIDRLVKDKFLSRNKSDIESIGIRNKYEINFHFKIILRDILLNERLVLECNKMIKKTVMQVSLSTKDVRDNE